MNKQTYSKEVNVGMIGAIIGATVALAFMNRETRKKIIESVEDAVSTELRDKAKEFWKTLKNKGDSLLE